MSEWRKDFQAIYKLVKAYCSLDDATVAAAAHVSAEAVRQYSGKRMTMPDDVDSLCGLFQKGIEKLDDTQKKKLLMDVEKISGSAFEEVKSDRIGEHICAMLKRCHSNEKSHTPYVADFSDGFEPTGHIRAVVFDFDGTLTKAKSHTTWESIWKTLGYDVAECQMLHRQFDAGDFDHQEWCDRTAQKFIEKGLTRQQIVEIAKGIRLIAGCKQTLRTLRERNIQLYIVSGSIRDIIEVVLGDAHGFFAEIKANEFIFDIQTSILSKIVGTKYDFVGKANYIRLIANRLEIATSDILFVGNSNNDTLAYLSGAKTLCINPAFTNYHDRAVWHSAIVECQDLKEILRFIT